MLTSLLKILFLVALLLAGIGYLVLFFVLGGMAAQADLTLDGPIVVILLLLGVIAWEVYRRRSNPRRKIRQVHNAAWRAARVESETYYDKVQETLWR